MNAPKTPEQRERNAAAQRARQAAWTDEERARVEERRRQRHAEMRAFVIAGYGGACRCCGEDEPEFLTLDHVDDDGAEHRRELGSGRGGGTYRFYRWVIREGFPARLQLLCWNCNLGKRRHGVCPHQARVHELLAVAS